MSDTLKDAMDETVDDVMKAIKERVVPDYDGVVGEPPGWVPEWAVLYFEGYRDRLLSDRGFEVSALLKLIEQYRKEYFREEGVDSFEIPNFDCPETYPNGQSVDSHCFHDEIGFLTWLKWCVDQGKEKGLELLGGGFAVGGIKAVASQKAALDGRHAASRESKEFCISTAKVIWDKQVSEQDEIYRTGEMASMLFCELKSKELYQPADVNKVAEWLRDSAASGELDIPPEARKSGRPKTQP